MNTELLHIFRTKTLGQLWPSKLFIVNFNNAYTYEVINIEPYWTDYSSLVRTVLSCTCGANQKNNHFGSQNLKRNVHLWCQFLNSWYQVAIRTMIIGSYQFCWLNLQLNLHLWCPFNFLLSCCQNLHLWCKFSLSNGHWNNDNKVAISCQLWLAEFKTEFALMVPIFKFLLSSGHWNNNNKVMNSCQLWLAQFKTIFALMVPIFKFLLSSGNQNNANKVTSC